MPTYTFKTGIGEYITIEADDIDEALEKAGIDKYDYYEIIETDDFGKKCLFSAIADDVLFGE